MPDAMPQFVPWDKASRCPECKQTGELLFSNSVIGGTLHTFICRKDDCPTEGLRFFVQTDPNGNIPVNEEAWKKAHETRKSPAPDLVADQMHQKVHEMLAQQLSEETQNP